MKLKLSQGDMHEYTHIDIPSMINVWPNYGEPILYGNRGTD